MFSPSLSSPPSRSLFQHPGVLLSSYYTQETHGTDPDGVVLIWDLKFNKDIPDYVFNCHVSISLVHFIKKALYPLSPSSHLFHP